MQVIYISRNLIKFLCGIKLLEASGSEDAVLSLRGIQEPFVLSWFTCETLES